MNHGRGRGRPQAATSALAADDLAANAWTNPGGVNGCPAGSHGFHVDTRACEPSTSGGLDGRLVGWTIGAVGDNGQRLSGVNWTTSLMGVTLEEELLESEASDAAAINWIVDTRREGVNVRVIQAPSAWLRPSSTVRSAIQQAASAGILVVTDAGNDGEDIDAQDAHPCNAPDVPNLICVAASDHNDRLAEGSSDGPQAVHLAAPGVHICGSPYQSPCDQGTSTNTWYAAAYVSGVAALVWSYVTSATPEEVRSKILGNVDERPGLEGRVATGGRLNAYGALTGPARTTAVTPTTAGPRACCWCWRCSWRAGCSAHGSGSRPPRRLMGSRNEQTRTSREYEKEPTR